MGHGLRLQSKGVHVAFAAGTGALCFVDLVAFLIQANLGLRMGMSGSVNERPKDDEVEIDITQFQLHLYVSYPRREEGVALELFEALAAYCKRTNNPSFTLHLRLSQENVNPQRWDEAFIRQEIARLGGAKAI